MNLNVVYLRPAGPFRHDFPCVRLEWISQELFESIINHPAIPTRR